MTLGQIAQRLEPTFNEPLPCRLETLSAALERKSSGVVDFIDGLLAAGDRRPTVIVLVNASIHHSADAAIRDR
ncbi:hypothetical protein WJ88_25045 [Burkholderia ubonensis]|nr:hypothetical protein WJ88_25045 [Burkholderia ubonensis]